MGRKHVTKEKVAEEKPVASTAEKVDPPVVVALKEVDLKYLEIEREFEAEVNKLRRQYKEKLGPLLEARRNILDEPSKDTAGEARLATPSCKGFWFTALKRLPSTTDEIEPHDEPVLEYLRDVRVEDLDPECASKGFKFEFEFVDNSYFTNNILSVELHTKERNPYSKDLQCMAIKSTEIDWKPGKDVTVEKVAKKVKVGGAKKKKAKEAEEPRDSFFRSIFRNLKLGDEIPADINLAEIDVDDDEDFLEEYLDNQMEIMKMVKDYLVPHAVRVYTGEAFPDDEDDEDSEEEEDEDDDDDDDDDDEDEKSEEKEAIAPKKAAKKSGKGGARAPAGGQEKEECKQQ